MALDDKDIKIAKLRGALSSAPRPKPKPDAEWMIMYMDWFFQHRITTMNETK